MTRIGAGLALVGLLSAAACRIEDRTPSGTRRDDDAIRTLVSAYYRGQADHDWSLSRSLFWDSANVFLQHTPPDSGWRDFRTADRYHQYLARTLADPGTRRLAVRLFRLDVRQQGDLASAWVVTRRRPVAGEGPDEVGTVDNFVLRRGASGWRIAGLASTPDTPGPAR